MPERWGVDEGAKLVGGPDEPGAQCLQVKPGEVWAPASDAHIVSIAPSGAPFYRRWIDGREIHVGAVPAGTVNFIPSGAAPRALFTESFRLLHIYIPAAYAVRHADQDNRRGPDLADISNPFVFPDPALHGLGCLLETAVKERARFSRLYIDSLVLAITARLLVVCTGDDVTARQVKGGLAPWQIKRVCDRMSENLASEPSLNELAGLLDLSPEHFCRAFRRSTGLPPHRWLAKRRMDEAKSLLRHSSLDLEEVARRVGYSRRSAFGTAFVKATGCTPNSWRRNDD